MVCEICEVKGIIGIWIYIVFFFGKIVSIGIMLKKRILKDNARSVNQFCLFRFDVKL